MPKQRLTARQQTQESEPAPLLSLPEEVDLDTLSPEGIAAMQGALGNAAIQEILAQRAVASGAAQPPGPGSAFSSATSGAASSLPHQAQMERAFGEDFSGVSAHLGTPEAKAGLQGLGAHAAALGESVAFADANPDPGLVAHELAHVVQQRGSGSGGGVQPKAVSVSQPGDAAEQAADRAADAVVRGTEVPDVGTADGLTLHRSQVATNGGTFDNDAMYTAIGGTGAVGERIGANIMVGFEANDLVEAPQNGIALVQTVKSVTDRVAGTSTLNATRDQDNTAVGTHADDTGLVASNGAAVDISVHRPGRSDANHNPIYGVGFGAQDSSTSLQDGTPTLGSTQRGAHVKKPDGTFEAPVRAQMEDGPGRIIDVAGQTFEMTFEVAALVTTGPLADTYLGSVGWGWQSDAAGAVTLKTFDAEASGAPTQDFMTAASTWNAATFHDNAGTAVDTIDLPITSLTSSPQAASKATDEELLARLAVVESELSGLAPGPTVDATNKAFEQGAILDQIQRRGIRNTNSAGVWLVSDPAQYEDTVLSRLPTGAAVRVTDQGAGESFNQAEERYHWWQVTVIGGPSAGAGGWVMRARLGEYTP